MADPNRLVFQTPQEQDQHAFLKRLYFGSRDPLTACVARAYRDFSRTLHGFRRSPARAMISEEASVVVRSALVTLATGPALRQDEFDSWHRKTCRKLSAVYARRGFDSFHVGQAQKWINMAFKYTHVFGDRTLPGYQRHYGLGHVPLDSVILDRLAPFGSPSYPRWSRVTDYEQYLAYQCWIRSRFPATAPLAVEFHLWLTADGEETTVSSDPTQCG